MNCSGTSRNGGPCGSLIVKNHIDGKKYCTAHAPALEHPIIENDISDQIEMSFSENTPSEDGRASSEISTPRRRVRSVSKKQEKPEPIALRMRKRNSVAKRKRVIDIQEAEEPKRKRQRSAQKPEQKPIRRRNLTNKEEPKEEPKESKIALEPVEPVLRNMQVEPSVPAEIGSSQKSIKIQFGNFELTIATK